MLLKVVDNKQWKMISIKIMSRITQVITQFYYSANK